MDLTLTLANFATIPGGMAVVWLLLGLIVKAYPGLSTRAKIVLQAALSAGWAALAVGIFMTVGGREAFRQGIVLWLAVMAAQTFGYKTTEGLLNRATLEDLLGLFLPQDAPGEPGINHDEPAPPMPASATATAGAFWHLPAPLAGSDTISVGTPLVGSGTVSVGTPAPGSATTTIAPVQVATSGGAGTTSTSGAAAGAPATNAAYPPYGDQGSPEGRA